MRFCGISSAFANADITNKENHAGQGEENPTEQSDDISVPDAGRYEE